MIRIGKPKNNDGSGLFIPGLAAIILISLLTIGSQILKDIVANPAKSLRTE